MKYVYKCESCKARFGSNENNVKECEKCQSENVSIVECNLYECDDNKIISTLENEKLRRDLGDPVGTLNQWKTAEGKVISIHMLSVVQIDSIINTIKNKHIPKVKVDIMPFGKHKGLPITELPDNYLAWLFTQGTVKEPLNTKLRKVVWNKIKDNYVDEIIDKWAETVFLKSKVKR